MAEITSGSLIQDWYDRYVLPKKRPISLTSSAPQDFSLGLPASATPTPTAPIVPPATTSPLPAPIVTPEPVTATPAATEPLVPAPETQPAEVPAASWSDKLTKGLQDPAKMGLLGAGLSLMATPPRAVPYSAGEVIGNAGLHGLKFFQQAVDDKRKADMMTQAAEEHKLTREDRALRAKETSDYYKERLKDYDLTREAAALKEARESADKLSKSERAKTEVPMPILKDQKLEHLNGINWEDYDAAYPKGGGKKSESGNVQKFDLLYKTKRDELGRDLTSDEIAKLGKDAEGGGGRTPVGYINAVSRDLASLYYPEAKKILDAKGPEGMQAAKEIMISLNAGGEFGGSLSGPKVREPLSDAKKAEYDYVGMKAEEYAQNMTPKAAIKKAQDEYRKMNPPAAAKEKPLPPGAVRKVIKGKSYIKTADGKVYEE